MLASDWELKIPALFVAFIVGPTIVPILTALLVKARASDRVKVFVNMGVSAVASLVVASVASDGTAVISMKQLSIAFVTWLSSSGGYTSFWKPVLEVNEKVVPNQGIG